MLLDLSILHEMFVAVFHLLNWKSWLESVVRLSLGIVFLPLAINCVCFFILGRAILNFGPVVHVCYVLRHPQWRFLYVTRCNTINLEFLINPILSSWWWFSISFEWKDCRFNQCTVFFIKKGFVNINGLFIVHSGSCALVPNLWIHIKLIWEIVVIIILVSARDDHTVAPWRQLIFRSLLNSIVGTF